MVTDIRGMCLPSLPGVTIVTSALNVSRMANPNRAEFDNACAAALFHHDLTAEHAHLAGELILSGLLWEKLERHGLALWQGRALIEGRY